MKFVNIVRNSSGSVGIGTSEPSARLYVTGSFDATQTNVILRGGFLSPLDGAGILDVQNSAGTSLLFVSGSGAVGIGTTVSQLPSHRLHVAGKMGGGLYVDSSLEFKTDGTTELKANSTLKLGYALTTVIDSSGQVGINTTVPAAKLDFGLTTGKDIITLYNNGTNNQYGFGISANTLELYTSTSGVMTFNKRSGASYVETVRIDSSGNVGIGTSLLDSKLVINGNTVVSGTLNPDSDNTRDLGISSKRWRNLYAGNIYGSLTGSNLTSGQVVVAGTGGLLSGSNNFWWDNTNGRVGIGTSNLSYDLVIGSNVGLTNRNIFIQDSGYGLLLSAGSGISKIQSRGTSMPLEFQAGNGNDGNYWFSSTGKVGIGTTTGIVARFTVTGSTTTTVPTMVLREAQSMATATALADFQNAAGTSLLFVSGSGFVGIGTNSSAYASAPKLDVVAGGDGRYALFERTGGGIAISLGSTSTTKLYNSWYSAGGGYYKIGYSGTLTEPSDSVSLVQDTSGNVGIGTSVPATKLAVYSGAVSANYGVFSGSLAAYVSAGALYTYWNTTSNYGTIVSVADGSGTAAPMQLRVGTSLAAHIDSSGNVGIGTASVSGKLHVYNASTATQYIGTVNHTLRLSADDSLGGVEISNAASTPIIFKMGAPGNEIGRFLPSGTWAATGSFEPGTDNTYDLGSSTKRWRNLYVNSVSGSLTGSNLTAGQIVVVGTGGVLSGSNKLYWYNANNWVGIGTNSPASQVDLYGTSGGRVQLGFDSPAFGVTIQAAATPWARYYSFQNSSNTILGSFGGYGGSNSLTYLFIGAAYDNTALRADQTTGNVTIGNASGTGRLYVTGSSTATTPTMVVREGVVTPQGGAGTFDVQNSAGTSLLFVSGSGNVGVGTNTPSARLHVLAGNTSTAAIFSTANATQSYIQLAYNTSTTFGYVGNGTGLVTGGGNTDLALRSEAGGNILFASAGSTERARFDTSGHLLPGADNTYNLGSSAKRWATIYATSVSGSLTGSNVSAGQVVVAGSGGVLSGSNSFWWDNTNSRVGIGITSPSVRLDIASGSMRGYYYLSTYDGELLAGADSGGYYYATGFGKNTAIPLFIGSNATSIIMSAGGSERVRIVGSNGNVGIGTNAPTIYSGFTTLAINNSSTGGVLDLMAGGTRHGTFYATAAGTYAGSISSTFFGLLAAGVERVRIDSSGNVGIGTNTYSARLFVSGSSTASTPTAVIREGVASPTGGVGVLDVQNSSGTSLLFVSGSGNVGVGTSLPSTTLHILSPNSEAARIASTGTNMYLDFRASSTSQRGFLGTGAALIGGTTANDFALCSVGASGNLLLGTGVTTTERMRITPVGDVGIGTSNTNGNKLAVNGQVSVTGSILPGVDNTYDLGSSSPQYRWRTLFATNISGSITPTGATAGSVFFAGASGQIAQDNANFFWDDTNNRLGIGTSSPGQSLSVVSSSPTVASFKGGTVTAVVYSDNSAAAFGDGTGGPGGAGTEFWYLHPGSLYASLYTNSAERMRVDSSGNVGINTTSMSLKLEVSGSDAKIHDVRIGRGPGAAITNTLAGGNSGGALGGGAVYATIFGAYAGNYISTGNYNTLVGTQAGNNITTASNNTYLGANAGYRQSGGNNTSVGRDALIGGVGASATANTAIGVYAGQSVTSGGNNFFGGYQAGYSTTTGASNVALGSLALYSVSEGNYNVGAGYQAGYGITSGSNNVNLGYQSGYGITTGAQNILVGTVSGYRITTANYNTHVGGNAGVYNSASGNASLGYQALAGVDGSSTGANNVAIGYQAAYGSTTGYENVVIGYIAGYSTTSAGRNVVIGSAAGNAISTGGGNVAIGYAASYRLTTGTQTVSIGSGAAAWNTASDNTAVGFQALYGISGLSSAGGNTALGSSAGYSLTTGTRNLFAGYQAGLSNSVGNYNVMLGNLAGYATTSGSSNIAVGSGAAYALTTGNYNTVVGDSAGYEFTTASSNTYLGRYSGIRQLGSNNVGVGAESLNGTTTTSTASNNTAVGYRSGYAVTTGAGNVALGYRSGYALTTGAANVYIGNDVAFQNSTGTRNVIIGDTAGNRGAPSDVTLIGYRAGIFASGINNTALGSYALYGVDGSSTATNNTALGYQAGYSVTTGGNNTALGYQAGFSLTTGDQNVIVGRTAGYTLTGEQYNTFVGMNAGRYTKSSQNTSLGFDALLGQSGGTSTGAYNVAVGYGAGRASQTGNGNVFTGYQAGLLATDGNYNTLLGHQAGQTLTTGANNVVVGSGAATATATSSNSIVIGSGSIGIGSNTTVLGNSSTITTYLAGNVGVGTTSFTGRLYVSGSSSATPTIVARAGVPSPSAAILAALDNDATTRFAVYGVSNGGYGGTFGVGIGTNDPFDTLHVYKNEAGYDHYPWFSNAATGGGTILTLQGEAPGSNAIRSLNSFSNESWYIGGNGSANILAFKTNGGTERMRIDSSGNVGIGTATVSARLHVLGSTTTTTPTMLVKERQAADTGVAILDIQNSSGTSLFFVSGSGFIGVGTNTVATAVAGAYFHVSSSLAGNANAGISVGSQLLGTSINVYKGHTQIFQLANGTETVRITGAGNVGIGTGANISSKLVVNGNTSVTGSVLPGADNTYDLGSASPQLRWRTLHAVNISGSLSPTGATPGSVFFAGASGQIQQDNANLFWDDTNNRLGVGTATPGFKLEVFGDFAATSKSFVIPHPLKPGWKLRHGSLEGPENGIYTRGRSESEVIDLPDYWVPLADENSITVHITPVGKWQSLYVDSVENNQIKIGRGWFMRLFRIKPKYFYVVTANRKDHTFEVEYSPLG